MVAVTTGKDNVSLLTKDQSEIRERKQEKDYAKLRVNIFFCANDVNIFFAPTVQSMVKVKA